MTPHGLPEDVAMRNHLVVARLAELSEKELEQTLGILWKEVAIAASQGIDVVQARDDLGWITTSFKLAQFLS